MRYTAPAAMSAPANAKAVRPTASRSVRPSPKLCPITTPNAAPAEIPSTEGSASGFRVSAWNATPATASAPPASIAAAIRGRRIDRVTTRSTDSGAARPATAEMTALGESCALPRKSAPAAARTSTPDSVLSTRTRRLVGLTEMPPDGSPGRAARGRPRSAARSDASGRRRRSEAARP